MSDTDVRYRCADRTACVEVTARVEAAHVARYSLGEPELAGVLLAQAQRFADVHGHGARDEVDR